jgi:hypothetical protein
VNIHWPTIWQGIEAIGVWAATGVAWCQLRKSMVKAEKNTEKIVKEIEKLAEVRCVDCGAYPDFTYPGDGVYTSGPYYCTDCHNRRATGAPIDHNRTTSPSDQPPA